MNVLAAMTRQDRDGALLVLNIARAHPKEQAAALQLLPEMFAMPATEPARKHRADRGTRSAKGRRRSDRGRKRTA